MKAIPQALLDTAPAPLHPQLCTYWEHLTADAPSQSRLERLFSQDPNVLQELISVWVASDFAATLCGRKPQLLVELLESGDLQRDYGDWPAQLLQAASTLRHDPPATVQAFEAALKKFLRQFRQREILRIIWRDITGKAALMETCADMTAMADAVLQFALEQLYPWCCTEMGVPRDSRGQAQQMVVIAMGKYGAGELNISSDIDLIFSFPEGGETTLEGQDSAGGRKPRSCTHQVFFTRLGQRLIDAVDSTTADGLVFRTDLRLRPYGESGALAQSFSAMEQYYQSQGRDWERFAMIKARVVAGDKRRGAELMTMLRPFVYRRYLDFAAIDALRGMKKMIMQQVRRKGMEKNIKLGWGGIREIEFIVQVLQLIYGGRHRNLQDPRLLVALDALVADDYLSEADARELRDSYFYLRQLEHRLQALQDRQTQTLPLDANKQIRVAFAMGHSSWQALEQELHKIRLTVAGHFQELIAEPEQPADRPSQVSEQFNELWQGELDEERARQVLMQHGFEQADQVLKAMHDYRGSKQFGTLEAIGRERLDRLMAVLLEEASQALNPDLGFLRVFSFVQNVTRRSAYLVLLLENRVALQQLVALCEASPWVEQCLSKYPVLLDELLTPMEVPPPRDELADDLRLQLLRIPQEDLDLQMESLRYFKLSHVLQVAAAELAGTMPLMKVSDYLTWIAEVVLEQVLDITWQMLCRRHGLPFNTQEQAGNCDFAVIAYGKLGGIELNYGSDLDLVFLHDGHADRETQAVQGQRAINSRSFYSKLGQRIVSMLNTVTVSGRLYEVDMRLRPSGASGLLVSSLSAFEHYQHKDAWTWEHQALVRARPVAGSRALARAFAQVRRQVLRAAREPAALGADICAMRARMRRELGSPQGSPLFEIKQDVGGLVDIEFMVQYLVLAWAHEHEDLVVYSDNIRLLEAVERNGLLEADKVQALKEVYILYRSRLHRLALQNSDNTLPDHEYREERDTVRSIWNRLFPDEQTESV